MFVESDQYVSAYVNIIKGYAELGRDMEMLVFFRSNRVHAGARLS